ncbi:UDP-N-acetylglucosamine 1-carboxyvinyltransferase [Candidatus Dependentiae bacterium Noda2021]|nr:UDP-N-acetylglucosamine 1-carboxyvinyltransferase [Candidatus Dependentiae bacterium Noda2021]
MVTPYIIVEQSQPLKGQVSLNGAKNAVLVIIASLILTRGKSVLHNVPKSDDVLHMISLLKSLGASVFFFEEEHILQVDTTQLSSWNVNAEVMKKMRASILVMGPLLARFGKADIAAPGGCVIGSRPIDFHLKNFKKMGATVFENGDYLSAVTTGLRAGRYVLEYPSVGATENILMSAVLTPGQTYIVNAALEPEVMDLIDVLRKMGANIQVLAPATLCISGVSQLQSVEHTIIPDRLEAGSLLIAAAITKGEIEITNAIAEHMDVFLLKLEEMGHSIRLNANGQGIYLKASQNPRAVSFKTSPYPGFPTDLQAPMMAAQCIAEGISVIEETVFENRLVHVRELQKMGAQIKQEGTKAIVTGVEHLYGAQVIATDIRASCSLVLAGLCAKGTTRMTGIHHWTRGYDHLEKKLGFLGGNITIVNQEMPLSLTVNELGRENIL